MAELDGIWWSTTGDGPAVVAPWLNTDCTEVDLSPLTDVFRVVTVAPRGFGPSTRLDSYAGAQFVHDIERVVDHLAIESYATFGYSMNGAMAARLAVGNPRVTAVACGGFPLTADLTGMGQRARARHAIARQDPDAWAGVVEALDPEALVAFWDDIARLPRAALAEVACPVRAWWGARDAVLASLLSPVELSRDLESRDVEYHIVPGLDHDEMLDRLDLVLPTIASWLADRTTQEHRADPARRRASSHRVGGGRGRRPPTDRGHHGQGRHGYPFAGVRPSSPVATVHVLAGEQRRLGRTGWLESAHEQPYRAPRPPCTPWRRSTSWS